jgi:hypothetical protein
MAGSNEKKRLPLWQCQTPLGKENSAGKAARGFPPTGWRLLFIFQN